MTTQLAADGFMTVDEIRDSGACPECLDSASDEQILAWDEEASDLVAIVTGMKVAGRFSLVARPCREGGRCRCDCCHLDSIPLGDLKPTIDEVLIDGEVIPAEEYDVHWGLNGWSLVRVGDGVSAPPGWPSYQKRYLADTEVDTFAVYFTVGVNTDQTLITAAILELVCESATHALGGYQNVNVLESGVIQAQVGNSTVVVDRERLQRLQAGEMGAAMSKLVGVYAPTGRSYSAVYAPELQECWNLNLRVPPVIAS
jgi:hypothetical protein